MQSNNIEVLFEGIKLAAVGMGMVAFFLTLLVFVITVSSKIYLTKANNRTDSATIAAISTALKKFRENKKL